MPEVLFVNPPLWYYQSLPQDIIVPTANLYGKADYGIYDLNCGFLRYVINQYSSSAQQVLSNPDTFFDAEALRGVNALIGKAFAAYSARFKDYTLSWNKVEYNFEARSYRQVMQAAADVRGNPFYDFLYQNCVDMLRSDTRTVYISVYHPEQVIPLFTLCTIIKSMRRDITICVYGNLEDQINTNILFSGLSHEQRQETAKLIDRIYIGEYYNLLHAPAQGLLSHKLPFGLSAPYLDSLPSTNLMPEDVFNLVVSQGCYWGKCVYCSICRHGKYRQVSAQVWQSSLDALSQCKQYSIVRFRDCCISHKLAGAISSYLLKNNMALAWCCRARFEDAFSYQLLKQLHDAGCVMISFGLESFNEEVNRRMNKGIDLSVVDRILTDCARIGINVKLTSIVGFPGETQAQLRESLDKISAYRSILLDIRLNEFLLFRDTHMAAHPEAYGIAPCYRNGFDFNLDYHKPAGEAVEVGRIIAEEYANLSNHQFLSEEHMLLYRKKYGYLRC